MTYIKLIKESFRHSFALRLVSRARLTSNRRTLDRITFETVTVTMETIDIVNKNQYRIIDWRYEYEK